MRSADAFQGTLFLGLAHGDLQDPFRLELLARHLEADECPLVLLPIRGGSLLVTDRRILELRPHLEAHGAWNVRTFQGYEVRRALPRASVRTVGYRERRQGTSPRGFEGVLCLTTDKATEEILVARTPGASLTHEEVQRLRDAILGGHPK